MDKRLGLVRATPTFATNPLLSRTIKFVRATSTPQTWFGATDKRFELVRVIFFDNSLWRTYFCLTEFSPSFPSSGGLSASGGEGSAGEGKERGMHEKNLQENLHQERSRRGNRF
jgi:hypothetical protein